MAGVTAPVPGSTREPACTAIVSILMARTSLGGGSAGGDDDRVARRPDERHRVLPREADRPARGQIHPERPAADRDLEAHARAQERDELQQPLDAVLAVLGRAADRAPQRLW